MPKISRKANTDSSSFFANPIAKKLGKINEKSDNHATYRGITQKCLFFMLMVVCGVVLSAIIHNAFPFIEELSANGIYISVPEAICAVIGFVLFIIGSFVTSLVSAAAPVAGVISCISLGFVYSTLANMFGTFKGLVLLALIITIAIVLSMQFLFMQGKITVNKKFRAVSYTLLLTYAISSILVIICYFISSLRAAAEFVLTNPLISIVMSFFGIIAASLSLLVDFDTINNAVVNKLPKQYEWTASFSLTFTIIWLYLEVLDLLGDLLDI